MAGSYTHSPPENDHTLDIRLEGLKLLADQLSEPVVVFDSTLRLLYSNTPAESLVSSCPLLDGEKAKCLDTDLMSQDTCFVCPGKQIIEQSQSQRPASKKTVTVHHDDPNCPFSKSVPVFGSQGNMACVLMMGERPQESLAWRTDQPSQPHSKKNSERTIDGNFHQFIGKSDTIQKLLEMIQLVATSEATVLIEGESGTGKELVAKTIHELSSRRDHPFVVVECSSLSETLLESELFGHVCGAFTGAITDRKGLFEEAEGGTIFLDEITDTSPSFQAKLLRVLQEGEIKPVGSSRTLKVNVRIISACNKPLMSLVKAKAFRSDLYYRLAVLPLAVPPLRERREDIPLLVQHFLEQSCENNQKPFMTLCAETAEALVHHQWPGNVRELENVIERAVVTTSQSPLTIRDVFGHSLKVEGSHDLASIGKSAREKAEKVRILKALQETQGDKTKAARLLKISRSSLYNKLTAYNLT